GGQALPATLDQFRDGCREGFGARLARWDRRSHACGSAGDRPHLRAAAGLSARGCDLFRHQLQPERAEPWARGALRLYPRMTMAEPIVSIRGVRKSFGKARVLDGVDLDVGRGEAVVVIGASGSGKTTLLRCINALETYDDGSIRVDGLEIGYREGAS